MKFTRYYSSLLKSKGVPHLTVAQYQRIFNIVVIEARIEESNTMIGKIKDFNIKALLKKRNYSLYSKHSNLMRGQTPEGIFKEFSKRDW